MIFVEGLSTSVSLILMISILKYISLELTKLLREHHQYFKCAKDIILICWKISFLDYLFYPEKYIRCQHNTVKKTVIFIHIVLLLSLHVLEGSIL